MTATVFDNDMTAHVWAQQSQDSGRSHNGNLWFSGRTIYSYGTHFPLATFAADGALFLNADRSSRTTEGKHKGPVRRAVNYKGWSVPDLRALMASLDCVAANGVIPADYKGARERLTAYLADNWQAFPADSEAAAWLLRASGSRATWATLRARHDRAKAKLDATNAKRLKAAGLALAKETAAIPLDMVRVRMIQIASAASDWNRGRNLKAAVAAYVEAHKASEPGKVRDAVWQRVKLARSLADRLDRSKANERRAAIASLRRIYAGDYGAVAPINAALSERDFIRTALQAHGPAALRDKAHARLLVLDAEIKAHNEAAAAARFAEQEASRDAWLRGESVRDRYSLTDKQGGALLRAYGVEMDGCTVTGGTLETSQGATVPLRHAVRIFAFVRDLRERGEAWQGDRARPVRVGHFTVDRVEPSGDFVAGCHRINWIEVERLARELGVWDCPATALAGEESEAVA